VIDSNVAAAVPVGFTVSDANSWSAVNSFQPADTGLNANAFANGRAPRSIIEYIGEFDELGSKRIKSLDANEKNEVSDGPFVFRITAIGWGNDPSAQSILQTNFITAQ